MNDIDLKEKFDLLWADKARRQKVVAAIVVAAIVVAAVAHLVMHHGAMAA